MHVHLVQLDIEWENAAANRERVARLVGESSIKGGDLVLLPEMFDTGFSCNVGVTADRVGESQRFVCDLARERDATIVAGITIIDGQGRPRNRAIVAGARGEILTTYDKQHLFPLGSPSEADSLSAGQGTTLFDWNGLRVCPLICYDLRFPELFGEGLRAGAQAFAVIANWPVDRGAHWRALLIARAIENQAFVFAVNRCGRDPKLLYGGGSLVVDPLGHALAEADSGEQIIGAAVDPLVLEAWRGRFPSWRTRGGV